MWRIFKPVYSQEEIQCTVKGTPRSVSEGRDELSFVTDKHLSPTVFMRTN